MHFTGNQNLWAYTTGIDLMIDNYWNLKTQVLIYHKKQ